MPAYLLADVQPHDMDEYRQSGYLEAVPRIAAKYGGVYRARGGELRVLEGGWSPLRMAIIEFPSLADLAAWYEGEEYRPWRELRESLTTSKLVAVDGIGVPPA